MIRWYRRVLLLGVTARQSIAIGLLAFVFLAVAGALDAAASAARGAVVYLDPSVSAATLDECQRAAPELGRPTWSVSQRPRSDVPWYPRVCAWKE